MEEIKTKAKEILTEKESLQASLYAIFLHQNKLENKVLELTNEVVSTSDVYFERTKEQVLLLYPNLEFNQMDFLKVVQGG